MFESVRTEFGSEVSDIGDGCVGTLVPYIDVNKFVLFIRTTCRIVVSK